MPDTSAYTYSVILLFYCGYVEVTDVGEYCLQYSSMEYLILPFIDSNGISKIEEKYAKYFANLIIKNIRRSVTNISKSDLISNEMNI